MNILKVLVAVSLVCAQPVCADSTYYFTPYSIDEAHTAFIGLLDGAKKQIRMAIYSLNDPTIIDALVAAQKRGVDVELVCDKTQAGGANEKLQLARLKKAGIPFTVGQSAMGHIMHCKFVVCDKKNSETGSWNFTVPAGKEDNVLTFVDNESDTAAQLLDYWQKIKTDMLARQAAKAKRDKQKAEQ